MLEYARRRVVRRRDNCRRSGVSAHTVHYEFTLPSRGGRKQMESTAVQTGVTGSRARRSHTRSSMPTDDLARLSRRQWLKGAAAFGALVSLSPAAVLRAQVPASARRLDL